MATPTAAFQILAEEYLGYNVRLEVARYTDFARRLWDDFCS